MVHPHTELRFVSETIGFGVFATRLIPRGSILWVRDDFDQTFTPEQVARMEGPYQEILVRYGFVDAKGMVVLCWDHARFFNHSCEANSMSLGYDFEFAVRDIQAGEELTDDYGTLNPREPFACACESPRCRRTILPDDMERLGDHWDAAARAVLPLIAEVPQPLWALLREKEAIEIALKHPTEVRSIRCNYVPAP